MSGVGTSWVFVTERTPCWGVLFSCQHFAFSSWTSGLFEIHGTLCWDYKPHLNSWKPWKRLNRITCWALQGLNHKTWSIEIEILKRYFSLANCTVMWFENQDSLILFTNMVLFENWERIGFLQIGYTHKPSQTRLSLLFCLFLILTMCIFRIYSTVHFKHNFISNKLELFVWEDTVGHIELATDNWWCKLSSALHVGVCEWKLSLISGIRTLCVTFSQDLGAPVSLP